MKKIFLLFICFLSIYWCAFANTQQKLLAAYPNQGIYYYYIPKFDINTFKKPKDVELFESNYTIFIYDKEIPHSEFAHRNKIKIENNSSGLFDMILTGIEKKPTHYVNRSVNENNDIEVSICKLKQDNWQIKYMLNPKTNKFEKQVVFNNGSYGITSICNPNYVPFQDI